MSEFLGIYTNNPTAAQKDGSAVSEGSFTSPISFSLNATNAETGYAKLGIRCKEGYQANGSVTVKVEHKNPDGTYDETGGNVGKYALALDNGYTEDNVKDVTFGSSLTINNVTDTNVLFWLKCTSSKDEEPSTDKDCVLHAEGIVKAKA